MVKKKTMDGNEAAAYASYAFTEVAAIYPITPSSPMADFVDQWAASGMKNIFGQPVKLIEMQSEAGAVASMHGSLDGGSLSTSYTASQGMMLMIPTMYRIAGQLKPGVIHVASRNVATNNISIFAEHSDVMACRQTGFALLASSNTQECMDLGAVAHLSAIKGHVPFLHFFDGFRTSHEIQKVDLLNYDDLAKLVDYEELEKFRKRSLNPERPLLRTVGLNADTYFQCREVMNPYYDNLPDVVEAYMGEMSKETAIRHAKTLGKKYEDCNFVVCHIGGGVSVSAHRGGRMVDGYDIVGGEGPMAPTRCGSISVANLLNYLKDKDLKEVKALCTKTGGFVSQVGISDAIELTNRAAAGDKKAEMVWNTMIYQIAKGIGSMASVLEGKVDGILLGGGMVHSKDLVLQLKQYCGWIAPVTAYPGEFEMEAMAAGALRVLRGEETAKHYTGKLVWDGFAWDK